LNSLAAQKPDRYRVDVIHAEINRAEPGPS
jgi:hypothetical protein